MGPQSAKSYPGRRVVKPAGPKAQRAKQEIDYGRRGVAGHVFGAFQPAIGNALTAAYVGRTTANWVDFLGKVEAWIDPSVERVYAVMDNLNTHSATDVLLFALAHPRWEFVFQPKYAAYLNLIEPWWKILRSLALSGRGAGYPAPTGSPEAVACLRFPQNVACGFPAPRSSAVASQLSLLFAQVSFPWSADLLIE